MERVVGNEEERGIAGKWVWIVVKYLHCKREDEEF